MQRLGSLGYKLVGGKDSPSSKKKMIKEEERHSDSANKFLDISRNPTCGCFMYQFDKQCAFTCIPIMVMSVEKGGISNGITGKDAGNGDGSWNRF